jgi:hypothetical protein
VLLLAPARIVSLSRVDTGNKINTTLIKSHNAALRDRRSADVATIVIQKVFLCNIGINKDVPVPFPALRRNP